jgi:hypothetical protein
MPGIEYRPAIRHSFGGPMSLCRRRASVLLVPALLVGSLVTGPFVAGATSAPAPYDAALSTPQEDSYYPAHGDPGIDALHYGLDLTWNRGTRTLRGAADITLRATGTADSFQLDLGDAMQVTKVTVDGQRVGSTHRRKVLRVVAPVVATGKDLTQFFDRWLNSPVWPPASRLAGPPVSSAKAAFSRPRVGYGSGSRR